VTLSGSGIGGNIIELEIFDPEIFDPFRVRDWL